jgi:hypothetical protein
MPRIAAYMLIGSITVPGQGMQELPSCGVMAVYTVAHHYELNASLSRVESLLGTGIAKQGGHSLEQVRSAIGSLGLHARSVKVTAGSLDRLNCPSIMYVRPERLGPDQRVGHFAVLQSVTGDVVRIVDLTRSPQPRDISREALFSAWDGECLEISDKPFLVPTAATWKVLWSCIALCSAIFLWRGGKKRNLSGSVAVLSLACCGAGCSENPPPAALITFEKPAFSAGTVPRGPDAEVRCRFTVGEQKVVITEIDSRCGCIRAGKELVGEELLPGTEHSFGVKLSTFSRFAESGGTLTVYTQPPSPEPIQCHVSAYIDSPPVAVGTLPLRVETTWGEMPAVPLVLEHFRGRGRQPVEWDEPGSDLAGFSVMRTDVSSTRNSPTLGSMVGAGDRDVFHWDLRPPGELTLGRHSFELKVAWKGGAYPPQTVPVEVNVTHPIRTSLERVFFGVIEQGKSKVVEVTVTNWNAETMRSLQVESDGSLVDARLDVETGSIRIELSRLAPVGRLQANVRVKNGRDSAELVIPVTAVIVESRNVSSDS